MVLVLPTTERSSLCGQPRRLACFVLGSLLLHVVVAVLWRGEPPAGPVARGTFQVTLIARQGDMPEPAAAEHRQAATHQPRQANNSSALSGERAKGVETEPGEARLTTAPAPPLPSAARIANNRRQEQAGPVNRARQPPGKVTEAEIPGVTGIYEAFTQGHSGATGGSTSQGQQELTSAARYRRVRDELLEALLPYFEYPVVARRRGWQGRVKIGLLVAADGGLTGIHLVESSGYAVLDKAAVKNVIELNNVPAARRWLDGRDMDVVLPVTYRLEDR